MIAYLGRTAAAVVLAVALTGVPNSAFAESDGGIEVGVVIEPLIDCSSPCVTPSPPGGLAQTGLDPRAAGLLALGLAASGAVALAASRRRSRSTTNGG